MVDVRVSGGVPVLVVEPDAARTVAELVDRAYRQHLQRRHAPLPEAEELIDVLGVIARAGMSSRGQFVAREVPEPSSFVSSAMAAEVIGSHPRTVRRKAANGTIPGAQRHGRDWLIPVRFLTKETHRDAEPRTDPDVA